MNVTIIGAGNMGRGLATRFLSGDHNVTVIDRDQDQAAELSQSTKRVLR